MDLTWTLYPIGKSVERKWGKLTPSTLTFESQYFCAGITLISGKMFTRIADFAHWYVGVKLSWLARLFSCRTEYLFEKISVAREYAQATNQ